MADEDRTRAGSRSGDTPPRHRPRAMTAGLTRSVLRRARQRRRWVVEGVAGLLGLVMLISYFSFRSGPEPDDQAGPGGVSAGAAPSPRSPGRRRAQRRGGAGHSRSASAPASALAGPDTVGQPARPPPPPAKPGSLALSVSRGEMPAAVDLTAVGTRDWVHWGERDGRSTVRKRSGSGEIIDGGGAGRRVGWDGNQEYVRWSDGTPERSDERHLQRCLHLRCRERVQPRRRRQRRAAHGPTLRRHLDGSGATGSAAVHRRARQHRATGRPLHQSERPVHHPLHSCRRVLACC